MYKTMKLINEEGGRLHSVCNIALDCVLLSTRTRHSLDYAMCTTCASISIHHIPKQIISFPDYVFLQGHLW
jgi:hypothetical protein